MFHRDILLPGARPSEMPPAHARPARSASGRNSTGRLICRSRSSKVVVRRNVAEKAKAVDAALAGRKKWYPTRAILFLAIEDQSGSMANWRQPVGQFWPAVTQHFIETGGEKVAALIFVLR